MLVFWLAWVSPTKGSIQEDIVNNHWYWLWYVTPSNDCVLSFQEINHLGHRWGHSLQLSIGFSSVQSLSRVWLFVTPWTAACQDSLSITNSQSLLKLMSIKLAMPSNHLILCRPLLLLPLIFPGIRIFSNESVLCNRWPKCWGSSFSIHPSNEHSGRISCSWISSCWLGLLAVPETLKSLLHSPKASILRHSAFFKVQLSHPRMTTGKTIALSRRTFVGKVISLLFNMLYRLVIAFLPRIGSLKPIQLAIINDHKSCSK